MCIAHLGDAFEVTTTRMQVGIKQNHHVYVHELTKVLRDYTSKI